MCFFFFSSSWFRALFILSSTFPRTVSLVCASNLLQDVAWNFLPPAHCPRRAAGYVSHKKLNYSEAFWASWLAKFNEQIHLCPQWSLPCFIDYFVCKILVQYSCRVHMNKDKLHSKMQPCACCLFTACRKLQSGTAQAFAWLIYNDLALHHCLKMREGHPNINIHLLAPM